MGCLPFGGAAVEGLAISTGRWRFPTQGKWLGRLCSSQDNHKANGYLRSSMAALVGQFCSCGWCAWFDGNVDIVPPVGGLVQGHASGAETVPVAVLHGTRAQNAPAVGSDSTSWFVGARLWLADGWQQVEWQQRFAGWPQSGQPPFLTAGLSSGQWLRQAG